MTMENGEGRPLDEAEAGEEDPQAWYFDLPGGAWERQEEKNRTLRQRVLGNFEEDAEASKGDPFGRKFELKPQAEAKREAKPQDDTTFELKPQEPGQKKRGLFGFGKKSAKNEPQESPRTNEAMAFDTDEPEADDEWTTEPPLKLTPFPRAERPADEVPWGDPDGGWDLERPAADDADAPSELRDEPSDPAERDGDIVSGMRAWAEASEHPDALAAGDMPTLHDDLRDVPEVSPAPTAFAWQSGSLNEDADDASHASDDSRESVAAPEVFAFNLEAETATEDNMANGKANSDDVPAADSLTLRPRARVEDEKQLDWNFGPAAWGNDPAPIEAVDAIADVRAAEAPEVETEDEAATFESMRKWAERAKDDNHPHFTTAAHNIAGDDEPSLPAPIPLRPRHQDETEPPASKFAPLAPRDDPDDAAVEPPSLPIMLRSRTEQQAEPPVRDPADGPSKWDEFFNLAQAEEGSDETPEAPSEGIAAMRDWATKQAEPESTEAIPEQFLKPFDWELQEDSDEPANASNLPAELLKPFDWETDSAGAVAASGDDESVDWEEAPDSGSEMVAATDDETAAFVEAVDSPIATGLNDDDVDDPLAGIFEQAIQPTEEKTKKKSGRFGRFFGRKKDNDVEPAESADRPEDVASSSDWILPGDDEAVDVRGVASEEQFATNDPELVAAPDEAKWQDEPAATADLFGFESEPEIRAESVLGDVRAVSFESAIVEPVSELLPEPPDASQAVELTAAELGEAPAEADSTVSDAWNPEPIETVGAAGASIEASDDGDAWAPLMSDPEEVPTDQQGEAVASIEAVAEEPPAVAAWWERDEAEEVSADEPVEPVASVEMIVEEAPAETAWWERDEAEEVSADEPLEAVASLETIVEEAPAEKPWWERDEAEEVSADEPVEPVASVEM
ncbi:MAG: hypothetical protein WBO97_01510, partial [Tepidiformaceae bacterium]